MERCVEEVELLKDMENQNIVKLLNWEFQGEQNYLVYEYCDGGTLEDYIRDDRLSEEEIFAIFIQLLNGFKAIRLKGYMHRDIKPENLLLNDRGQLKITDFGVSDVFRMVWETTAHTSKGLCGSEPYIAPEEFVKKEYDARLVDIWATGIVYYTMNYIM